MRNRLTKVIQFTALMATGGAFSFLMVFSNCGGSSTGRPTGTAGTTGGAGTMGNAGTMGGGGTTGSGGVTESGGTNGMIVMHTCTPKPDLMCSASAVILDNGKITDFEPTD